MLWCWGWPKSPNSTSLVLVVSRWCQLGAGSTRYTNAVHMSKMESNLKQLRGPIFEFQSVVSRKDGQMCQHLVFRPTHKCSKLILFLVFFIHQCAIFREIWRLWCFPCHSTSEKSTKSKKKSDLFSQKKRFFSDFIIYFIFFPFLLERTCKVSQISNFSKI